MAKKNIKTFAVETEDARSGFHSVNAVKAESAIRARLIEKRRVKDTAIIISVTQIN